MPLKLLTIMKNTNLKGMNDFTDTENAVMDKRITITHALENPVVSLRSLISGSLYYCLKYFWDCYSLDRFEDNWHIKKLAEELEYIARRVAAKKINDQDLIINVPPGTTKTALISIFFPVWCWINWHWMRFITTSHTQSLSLESAEYSRDIIKSEKFHSIFPELVVKQDKDKKSNFRVVKTFSSKDAKAKTVAGGGRISTSISGSPMGFHAHIIIMDDLLDPKRYSQAEITAANTHLDRLSTRKTDKRVSTMILVMQRLSVDDPTDYMIRKRTYKTKSGIGYSVRHISLPGEIITNEEALKPKEWKKFYVNGLLDKNRLNWRVIKEMEMQLGQYGYNAQIGQFPLQVTGNLFKTDKIAFVDVLPPANQIIKMVRYWDKAGTGEKELTSLVGQAFTAGVKMAKLRSGNFLIVDVIRGHWAAEEREQIIKATAVADGREVAVYVEQEPGSGGKESAQNTIRNLAGFTVYADRPQGDKVRRADPYSVQVNHGNVTMLRGSWNQVFVDEHKVFPHAKIKDQVDAAAGAFNALFQTKTVESAIIRINRY